MDGISILVGIGTGLVLGGAGTFVIAQLLARSRGAVGAAAAEAMRGELDVLKRERDTLRGQASAALQGESSAKATLAAMQQTALGG